MRFEPGFRLSRTDLIVIASGLTSAYWLQHYSALIAQLTCFVLGHFFVFCNVIRLSRRFELLWAAALLVLALAHVRLGVPSVPAVAAICVGVSLLLITIETRKPSYHGVFWQHLNPGLRHWFETHGDQTKLRAAADD